MNLEHDILSFNNLKTQPFTGSHQGMRYCIRKMGDEKKGEPVFLEAFAWPEPFSLKHTNEALIEREEFSYSEEGRSEAIRWLEERYEARKGSWNSKL